MIQPLNHDYIPKLTNVWPELQDPYYDKGSLYSVPVHDLHDGHRMANGHRSRRA